MATAFTEPDSIVLMVDVWDDVVDEIQINPPPTQDEVTDLLQVKAPDLTDAEGDAFTLAVSQLYQDLGITSQNTYISLRNEIDTAGAVASKLVFGTIKGAVAVASAAEPLLNALVKKAYENERDQIPLDIVTVETDRDLQSDQVLIDAYDRGIVALNRRTARVLARLTAFE